MRSGNATGNVQRGGRTCHHIWLVFSIILARQLYYYDDICILRKYAISLVTLNPRSKTLDPKPNQPLTILLM